jgi:hypothetical protein
LVNVTDPDEWEILDYPIPVRQLQVLPDQQRALLVGEDSLACYSEKGILWRSRSLVIDDLRIKRVRVDSIVCQGYVPWDEQYEFELDLHTGEPLDAKVADFSATIARQHQNGTERS